MHCSNCRAALAPGSRFCNACGAVVGAARPAAGGDRTQSYAPPTPPRPPAHGLPPRPQAPPPGYSPPPPPGGKKPVLLLSLILAVVAVGVVGATMALVKGRQAPVVSGPNPNAPGAPPVTEVASSNLPGAPAVTTGPNRAPAPGPAVTGTPSAPPPDTGMAPPLTMAPGFQPPAGSSVTTVPGVRTPEGPGVTFGPSTPAQPQKPVTSTPSPRPNPNPPVTAAPRRNTPTPPNTDRMVDDYLKWLHYVEDQRQKLTEAQTNQSTRRAQEFMQLLIGLSSDDPEIDRRMQQLPQQAARDFQAVLVTQQRFWTQMDRSKPPVPPDCRYLDSYYMAAAQWSLKLGRDLADAFARGDIGRIKTAMGNQALVDSNLRKANQELSKIRDVRRLPEDWLIQPGGGGGGAGGLMGLPGLGG